MDHNATPQQIGTDIGKQLWNVFATSIGPYEDESDAHEAAAVHGGDGKGR